MLRLLFSMCASLLNWPQYVTEYLHYKKLSASYKNTRIAPSDINF